MLGVVKLGILSLGAFLEPAHLARLLLAALSTFDEYHVLRSTFWISYKRRLQVLKLFNAELKLFSRNLAFFYKRNRGVRAGASNGYGLNEYSRFFDHYLCCENKPNWDEINNLNWTTQLTKSETNGAYQPKGLMQVIAHCSSVRLAYCVCYTCTEKLFGLRELAFE